MITGVMPPGSQAVHRGRSDARAMLPVPGRRAGRIRVDGCPTGVEVGPAMVHGG